MSTALVELTTLISSTVGGRGRPPAALHITRRRAADRRVDPCRRIFNYAESSQCLQCPRWSSTDTSTTAISEASQLHTFHASAWPDWPPRGAPHLASTWAMRARAIAAHSLASVAQDALRALSPSVHPLMPLRLSERHWQRVYHAARRHRHRVHRRHSITTPRRLRSRTNMTCPRQ